MDRLLHIVPATPPAFNGLGDYARMLQRYWPAPQPQWHVAAMRVTEGAEAAWPGVRFHTFNAAPGSLTKALEESGCKLVALHYVPFAYHPKGVPGWLGPELARWKGASGGKLTVFYHELFAVGPPWRTAFWLVPSAIQALRKVVALTDGALTSNDLYAGQLRSFGGFRGAAQVLPIGSNISPLEKANGTIGQPMRLAIFGAESTRIKTLHVQAPLLKALADAKAIGSIVLIGAGKGDTDKSLASAYGPVEKVQNATEAEVSHALASADYGLVATDEERIFKSGVFAAYCAHELLPVVAGKRGDMPYLQVNMGQTANAVAQMRDPQVQATLRARVQAHATRSDWTNVAKVWADAMA